MLGQLSMARAMSHSNFKIGSHLMKKKDCKGVDLVNAELIRTATETIVGQLQAAKEMYESGHLTKEEYTKAKKKILD